MADYYLPLDTPDAAAPVDDPDKIARMKLALSRLLSSPFAPVHVSAISSEISPNADPVEGERYSSPDHPEGVVYTQGTPLSAGGPDRPRVPVAPPRVDYMPFKRALDAAAAEERVKARR